MAEQQGMDKAEGPSPRWKVVAAGGMIASMLGLVVGEFWLGLLVLYGVVLLLALGKPFRSYRKFIYRGFLPASTLTLLVACIVDVGLASVIPDHVERLFIAFALGLPAGILPVLIVIELYGRMRLDWATTLSPDIDRKSARKLLGNLFLGLNHAVMIVDGPLPQTTRQAAPSGPGQLLQKLGGPGLLFVHHGYAVVLESGGKFTKVAKAGITFLDYYERPKTVIDLHPRLRTSRVPDVYTRDGVPLAFEIGLQYQIKRLRSPTISAPTSRAQSVQLIRVPAGVQQAVVASGAGNGHHRPPPASQDGETFGQPDLLEMARTGSNATPSVKPENYFTVDDVDLRNAVYEVDDWQAATEAMAGYILRDIIAEYNLDALFQVDASQDQLVTRAQVRETLQTRLNGVTRPKWGTEIMWVNIGCVTIPDEAKYQLLNRWLAQQSRLIQITQADGDKEAMVRKGEAEAAVLARVERVKTEVRSEIIKKIRDAVYGEGKRIPPEMADRFLDLVEQLTRELVTEDITRLRQAETYERIATGAGNKTFVIGAGSPFMVPDSDDK